MKTTINGNALVITSSLKVEDIQKIRKTRPEALTLYEEHDNVKEPVFYVELGSKAQISDMGIVFDGATHDGQKLATATVLLKGDLGNVKETVADLFGVSMARLQKLEAALPAVLESVAAERNAIMAAIEVQ